MKSYTNAILQLALERLLLKSISHTSIIEAGLTIITFVEDISLITDDNWAEEYKESIDYKHSKAIDTLQKEYPISSKKEFVLCEVKTLLSLALKDYEKLRKELEKKDRVV